MHAACISVLLIYAFFAGCLFHRITGFDCPFCGMTRAHLKFFCGEFKEAFSYHRLFPLGLPFVSVLAHMRVLKRKKPFFIAGFCFVCVSAAAFTVNYIVNLCS